MDGSCIANADMVWLWVDGSDPVLRREMREKTGRVEGAQRIASPVEEIRYSIRSYFAHIHWHRGRLVLLTAAGQVPSWMKRFVRWKDLKALSPADRLTHYAPNPKTGRYDMFLIVDHKDIAGRTLFNSTNIEMHLHRIPDASSVMIEWNDDLFAVRDVPSSTFAKDGKLVNLHGTGVYSVRQPVRTLFQSSMINTLGLVGLNPRRDHAIKSHTPWVIHRDSLAAMVKKNARSARHNLSSPFRTASSFSFLQGTVYYQEDNEVGVYESSSGRALYVSYRNMNATKILHDLRRREVEFLCVNNMDDMHITPRAMGYRALLRSLFPHPSPVE